MLRTQLYRGAFIPDEAVVMALPDDCDGHIDVKVEWDEEEDYVRVRLRGEDVLDPNPSIWRSEGEDYFPNEWWPEAEDIEDGRYLLWLIHVIEAVNFYYHEQTLELLGSEFDFETPPEPAIVVPFPAFVAVPTDDIDVDSDGDVDFTHEFDYDGLVRGDLPEFAHFVAAFVPHSLCTAHPFDYTVTSTRPYAGPTQDEWDALPFSEYLRNGLIFSITVEPDGHEVFPPTATKVVAYSQSLAVAGGVPRGWTNDLEAVFANLAPPIRPWEQADTCEDWFKPVRDRSFDICAPSEGGGE